MPGRLDGLLDKSALRRWDRAAANAAQLDPVSLEALRARARALGRRLERVVQAADNYLTAPATIPRPLHTDWAWRPALFGAPIRPGGLAGVVSGSGLGTGVKLFHDCDLNEVAIRQVRTADRGAAPPFELRLDVFRFRGSFVSLAIDLPEEGARDLSRRHLVRIGLSLVAERPARVFGRLNVRHGPNTEQVVRQFDTSDSAGHVDLDLSGSRLEEDRIERAWVDIIFEAPEMNQIRLGDVTLSRRPRAEF